MGQTLNPNIAQSQLLDGSKSRARTNLHLPNIGCGGKTCERVAWIVTRMPRELSTCETCKTLSLFTNPINTDAFGLSYSRR